jgi:hypothetical protein
MFFVILLRNAFISLTKIRDMKLATSFLWMTTYIRSITVAARGLRHELSSLAQTLGSWVRNPLEACMSVCVYSVFVLGTGLATG